jgi:hypothetical protein
MTVMVRLMKVISALEIKRVWTDNALIVQPWASV